MATQDHPSYPAAKRRYLVPVTLFMMAVIVCAAFGFTGNRNADPALQQILLRNIGHEILLHAGDSTSRVLPVQQIAAQEYQLRFEREFTFQTDSLVKIIGRAMEKDHLAEQYTVTVLSCSRREILYGYTISREPQKSIVPCLGRKQPRGCYIINIRLQHKGIATIPNGYLVGGLSVFAFIGLLVVRPLRMKRTKVQAADTNTDVVEIGATLFEPGKRQIIISGITTELTPKENKLLKILADSPGELIERHRLQKEIWEDEGVIVGRSLDVFISKLRKKLEGDASLQVVNIHGKGYRLQINDPSTAEKV